MKPKSRGNGQGTAYKRGNTWTAQVVIGWKNGCPVKRTKGGFKSKKDAINYCPTLLGLNPEKTAPKTLNEYWDYYVEHGYSRLSDSQQCSYRNAWRKLKPLHYRFISGISIEELQTTVSDACPTYWTAKDVRDLLANLYNIAAVDGVVDRKIPSFIVLPDHEETEREPFNAEEQKALWELYESGDMDAAIPLLMIYTGAMPGEVREIKLENIDLENHQITGVGLKTKTRKQSPIILSDTIIPVVESLMEHANKHGFLWKRNKMEWYGHYYSALEKAGCRKLPPYSCRHTTATALAINKNIAPRTVQKIMRWSTPEMIKVYAHPDIEHLVDAVNQIEK